ncbi:NADH:flavin oxidoreductase [Amycolatopsis japonica]|uniref:NADH:flavin oxidoreductase n=1 Tax=Amycolatopsis japonica TaxID=208439 RepID=UPI00382921DB
MTAVVPRVAPLFTGFDLGPLRLRNRVVMAPMTRQLSPNGVPGMEVAEYYARRARHEVGLIITEGTTVDHPAASSSSDVPRFHGADALSGWAEVVRAVHAAGGKIAPQLWHVGFDPLLWGRSATERDRMMPDGVVPVSPSGIAPDSPAHRPMTEHEITDVIDAFARAAADARRIGFDAIELHAAHGYLLDQFLWAATNHRTDSYGGDLLGRTRFTAEVVAACRRAVGPDFPIILRFSQWKVGHYQARLANGPDELERLLVPFVTAGVTAFHCSTRRFWRPEFDGSSLNLAGWTKKVTGSPVITVGSVGLEDSDFLGYLKGEGARAGEVDAVADRLREGEFDLVAVGRALLADPEWVTKLREGGDRRAFSAESLKTLY